MGQTGSGETILLVDDDALSREVLAAVLVGEGYTVLTVSSGEEAVSRLSATAVPALPGTVITAVLTDLQMPGLAGIDLARALRSVDGRPVPLLLMSASRPRPEVMDAYDGFMGKPLAVEQIAEVLRIVRTELSELAELSSERSESATAADPKMLQSPVLDEATYAQLASAMPVERVAELFRMCFGDADRQMREMEIFAAAGKVESFRRSAHTLKGSFGMIGARELAELAAKMEAEGPGRLAGRGAVRAGSGTAAEAANSTTKVGSVANFRVALDRLRRMLRSRGVDV